MVKKTRASAGDVGSILSWEDPLEKEIATHSNILAWEIPWTEESGELQSTGSVSTVAPALQEDSLLLSHQGSPISP